MAATAAGAPIAATARANMARARIQSGSAVRGCRAIAFMRGIIAPNDAGRIDFRKVVWIQRFAAKMCWIEPSSIPLSYSASGLMRMLAFVKCAL
jgi:hypothetical protein